MGTINDLIKGIEASDLIQVFVAIAGILVPAVITIFLFNKNKRSSYARERYEKLVFPLFNLLEPHLYNTVNDDIRQEIFLAQDLIKKYRYLAGGKILNVANQCYIDLNNRTYKNLCGCIDKEVDDLSKQLGIPKRPSEYRLNRRQYRDKISLTIHSVAYILEIFIVSFLMLLYLLYVLYFILRLFNLL